MSSKQHPHIGHDTPPLFAWAIVSAVAAKDFADVNDFASVVTAGFDKAVARRSRADSFRLFGCC